MSVNPSPAAPAAPPTPAAGAAPDAAPADAVPDAAPDAAPEAGADAELIAIEGADHADLHFFQREVWKIIADFFKEKLSVK